MSSPLGRVLKDHFSQYLLESASQPRHLKPDMMNQTCEEWITLTDNTTTIPDAIADKLNDLD
jgi:hypothetical protein